MSTRPVWAEISLSSLRANYRRLCQAAPPEIGLLPIVKANAYGHDARLCAPVLEAEGAQWLGVTGCEEGVRVRAVCPGPKILLMSGVWEGEAEAVIAHRLTPIVWEPYQLDLLEEAARQKGMGPASLPVHMEIDTGMARQGTSAHAEDASALRSLLPRFNAPSPLRLEGVMTHFSSPAALLSGAENAQLDRLAQALRRILESGHRPEWLHAGNSSTLVAGPDRARLLSLAIDAHLRLMLRPGLALYGYLDRFTCDGKRSFLENTAPPPEPVLTWKSRVTSLRTLRAGESAGYDATFIARRTTRLALLPAGYADGLNRLLSNRGHVLLRGEPAPIAGRISMDQSVVDVTEIPGVAIGDEAVLLGRQGDRSISAWEIAELTGTIPWEVLCSIGARVPRIAVE